MSELPKDSRRIREALEAAEWVQRLESGPLATTDRAEFVDWLRESPVHVAEMLRAAKVHRALAEFSDWPSVSDDAWDPDTDKATVIALHIAAERATRTPPHIHRVRRRRFLAAASVLIATSVGLGLILAPLLNTTILSTKTGEHRSVTLDDGSVIALAPSTALRIRLTSILRWVRLDHGEATFHVVKDANRPFEVTSARVTVRAVGTAFRVINNAQTVVVTVTEGRVAVKSATDSGTRRSTPGAGPSVFVNASQQIAVSPAGRATPVREIPAEPEPRLVETQLSLDGYTVADIVERLNAVNHIKIHVVEAALAERRLTGVFSATDPQSFVAFLEAAAGVGSVRRGTDIDVGMPAIPSSTDQPR